MLGHHAIAERPIGDVSIIVVLTYARPSTDVTDGTWLNQVGSNVNLYASIDESVLDDADYIISSVLAPSASDTCEVGLASATDPVASDNHKVVYRIRSEPSGGNLTVSLYQNTTLIASWSHTNVSATLTTITQTLSGAETDSITDYADLRLRFVASN